MNKDMKIILDFCMKNEEEKIQKMLNTKSNSELLNLFEEIVKDDPWIYLPAIEILIGMLYSDNESFIKIFCKLIEDTFYDGAFNRIINPVYEIAQKDKKNTLAIFNKMINMGKKGICTGIIISPLLCHDIVDYDIIHDLESNDKVSELHSLIAIREMFIRDDEKAFKCFISNLIKISNNVYTENMAILIDCFVRALIIDENLIFPELEKEMDKKGLIVASVYIKQRNYKGKYNIQLTKKALNIIETEEPDNDLIDDALIQIYETDKDFVVEKLHERLQNDKDIDPKHFLLPKINRIDPEPIIQMLEEEIDVEDSMMAQVGDSVLRDFFLSKEDWLIWCEKWKDDERKENVILRSLSTILTKLTDYEDSSIRDSAINIVKEFAAKKGLDYEEETKHINFGKDPHKGAENKEAAIKALFIIKRIRFPYIQIDLKILMSNLKKYPYLTKAIDAEWLINTVKSGNPHLLAYIYGKKIEYKKIQELAKEFDSENDNNRKLSISLLYNSLKDDELSQLYWEKVFKILDQYNIKLSSEKIKNISDAESFLTEAEVISRLAPYFKIEIEPDIEVFRPRNLDLLIEFNGEKALIEIAQVNERIELDVAGDVISLPGGKIKGILLSKFRKQLKSGEVDPKIPVIMVINLMHGLNEHDAYDSIYGQLELQFKKRNDTHEVVEEGFVRKNNSFYDEKNTNIVAAIATYKRNYASNDPLAGSIHEHPRINPKNPMSKEFRLRLRDALFGESESSNWKSLMKIKGINEEMAKKLHANGIEDINKLGIAKDSELEIESFNKSELHEYQIEARRIISVLVTGSIRFLNGIDNDTYKLLTEKGIYLVDQLLNGEIPEEINPDIIKIMLEDARRIKQDD